jgi:hypothetical protein
LALLWFCLFTELTSRSHVKAGLGTNTNIVGRDTSNTPGLNLWNIALLKSTKFGERLNV